MLEACYTKQFKKDVKLVKKRRKPWCELQKVIKLIAEEKKLPEKYQDHKLSGIYKNCRDCHIQPDWLLIYRLEKKSVTFVATGSHSDLF